MPPPFSLQRRHKCAPGCSSFPISRCSKPARCVLLCPPRAARRPSWGSTTASVPAPSSRVRCFGGRAGTQASALTAPAPPPQSLPASRRSTAELGAGLLCNGLSARANLPPALLRRQGGDPGQCVDSARAICARAILPPALLRRQGGDPGQCVDSARAILRSLCPPRAARRPSWGQGCAATASVPAPSSRLRGRAGDH